MEQSWEDLSQAFIGALDQHRAGFWHIAELARSVIADAPTDEIRSSRMGELARAAHCSKQQVRKLADLAGAFPQEWRYPDVAQLFYMAVLDAARRTSQEPTKLLDKALRNNWHVRRVNAIGTDGTRLSVSGKCLACGGYLLFKTTRRAGVLIPCPGCLADARAERRTLLDAFVIVGQLQ